MNEDNNQFVSMEEMAAMSAEAGLSVRPFITADPMDEEELKRKFSNFKMMRFTLFSIPSAVVFIQGPVRDLPPVEQIEENYKDYFSPNFCKVKLNAPTRAAIPEEANQIIKRLADPLFVAKLYNNKEVHVEFIEQLLMAGVVVNRNFVANKNYVIATLKDYRTGLDYWLKKEGFKSLKDWELRTYGESLEDLRVTKANMAAYIASLKSDSFEL